MRTLGFVTDPDKRRRIARETMEIYAPLAERLGMHRLKDELDDLAYASQSRCAQPGAKRLEFCVSRAGR
jgi:GTP pyrophosphokinase